MKNELWFKPELDMISLLKKHQYGTLLEYAEENQQMILSSWKTNEIDTLKKSLRLGTSILSSQAEKLQKNQRLFTTFKIGELSGTIDALNQLIYEKEVAQKISTDFKNEYKYIKHLDEIVLLLNLYGSLTHSEICEKLQFNAPTLTEIIKKIIPTKTINVTSAGKYKLYSLTDKGRNLVVYLCKSKPKKDELESILSQLDEYVKQTNELEKIKKHLKTFMEQLDAIPIFSGDLMSINFIDNSQKNFNNIILKIDDIAVSENSNLGVQINGELKQYSTISPEFVNLLTNRKEIKK